MVQSIIILTGSMACPSPDMVLEKELGVLHLDLREERLASSGSYEKAFSHNDSPTVTPFLQPGHTS